MTQKVANGFPQFYAFTSQSGKFFGTPTTQALEAYTDINLQNQLVGDSISILAEELPLLTVFRDGSYLHESQGFELIAPNLVRVFPGLLDTETIEFKKLVAASGVITTIPEVPPTPDSNGYVQTIQEATIYTDNFIPAIHALPPIVLAGKTRITTEFLINTGRIDVHINGKRVSVNDGIWSIVDVNTIELNDDYSAVRMKVDIIKQKVG